MSVIVQHMINDGDLTKKKYAIIGTPKALSRLNEIELPEQFRDNYELQPTALVYMNMIAGWTEEQCDEVFYIVETANFEPPRFRSMEIK